MASENKDIKNVEKTLKNHDGRVNRNLYQANNNIISLFEKFNGHDQETRTQMKKIDNALEALFAFVQSIVPFTANTKPILDKLKQIESHTNGTRSHIQDNMFKRIDRSIEIIHKTLKSVETKLNKSLNEKNIEQVFTRISQKYLDTKCPVHNDTKPSTEINLGAADIDDDTRKAILDIFGPNPDIVKSEDVREQKVRCKPNYRDLIDIRLGSNRNHNCENYDGSTSKKKKRKQKKNNSNLIDIRGSFNLKDTQYDYDDSMENVTENVTDVSIETSIATEVITAEIPISTTEENMSKSTDTKQDNITKSVPTTRL